MSARKNAQTELRENGDKYGTSVFATTDYDHLTPF
jgi:hypothetical protein